MATIAIIDYGAGNLHSVGAAFRRIMYKDDTLEFIATPERLGTFSHIVLPGVGAYGDCIHALRAASGMVEALEEMALVEKKPFLGICVGMQMLFERGLEHGEHAGLGWMEGEVVRLKPSDKALKIPHMGWNELTFHQPHAALENLSNGEHAYFVHSYLATGVKTAEILATTDYCDVVVAMVGRDNILGTQFHPEKKSAAWCNATG